MRKLVNGQLVTVKEDFKVTGKVRKACLEKYGFVNSVTVAKTRKALGL